MFYHNRRLPTPVSRHKEEKIAEAVTKSVPPAQSDKRSRFNGTGTQMEFVQIPDMLKSRFIKLAEMINDCEMTCSDLFHHYRIQFDEDVDPWMYGCQGFVQFLSLLPDVFSLETNPANGEVLVISKRSPGNQNPTDSNNSYGTLNEDAKVHALPKSSHTLGESLNGSSSSRVLVTAIRSPNKIYVQLVEEQEEFLKLHHTFKGFMEEKGHLLKVDCKDLQVGSVYAAIIDDTWYRVRFLKFKDSLRVSVTLIDYGIITDCPLMNLKKLPEELKIPEMALSLSLAEVGRPAGKLSQDLIKQFKHFLLEVTKNGTEYLYCNPQVPQPESDEESPVAVWLVSKTGVKVNEEVMKMIGDVHDQEKMVRQELVSKLESLIKKAKNSPISHEQNETISRFCKKLDNILKESHREVVKNLNGEFVPSISIVPDSDHLQADFSFKDHPSPQMVLKGHENGLVKEADRKTQQTNCIFTVPTSLGNIRVFELEKDLWFSLDDVMGMSGSKIEVRDNVEENNLCLLKSLPEKCKELKVDKAVVEMIVEKIKDKLLSRLKK